MGGWREAQGEEKKLPGRSLGMWRNDGFYEGHAGVWIGDIDVYVG